MKINSLSAEDLEIGPFPTAASLLEATLRLFKNERDICLASATAYFDLFPDRKDDPSTAGARDARMAEVYQLTAIALEKVSLDHHRQVVRATNPKLADVPVEEIDEIIASFVNY